MKNKLVKGEFLSRKQALKKLQESLETNCQNLKASMLRGSELMVESKKLLEEIKEMKTKC